MVGRVCFGRIKQTTPAREGRGGEVSSSRSLSPALFLDVGIQGEPSLLCRSVAPTTPYEAGFRETSFSSL